MEGNWREKTLEELEATSWDEPDFASDTVQKTHALRKTPLARFTAEDVRIMISQRISLAYLVPVAIEKLRKNLFVEGDFYPGDLLQSVLSIDEAFWVNNRALWRQVFELIRNRMWELEERYINAEPFLELS